MKVELIDVMGDDLRVAYIAGLIDADGCLSINKVGEGRYAPSLSFVNTSTVLIELVQKEFGGFIHKKKKVSDNHADVYELNIRESLPLLKATAELIPFLIFKEKKARLVHEYAASIYLNGGKKLSKGVVKERLEILKRWEKVNEV